MGVIMNTGLYFFSYSRKDTSFALELAKALREKGVRIWLDQLDISDGERWDRAVETAFRSCNGVMVVLTPYSVESANVMNEAYHAIDAGKQVIPLLYKTCNIPLRLQRMQSIDFTNNFEAGLQQLLRRIESTEPPGVE